MDNVVTVHHGGSVEEDEFGNISFVGMHRVSLIFNDRPLFSELFRRARDELHCNSNEDTISVEGVLHYGYGKSGRIFRWLLPIACQGDWEKYVKTVMKNEFQCLDLLVRKLSTDRIPHVYSPPNGHSPHRGLGSRQHMRIRHLMTLRFETVRGIWKMWLLSLMLNLLRMRLEFVLMLVQNVVLMMLLRPLRRFL